MDYLDFLIYSYYITRTTVMFNCTGSVLLYEESNTEEVIIYVGVNGTVEIGLASEYEEYNKKYNVESPVIYRTKDYSTIKRIANAIDGYYITALYQDMIEELNDVIHAGNAVRVLK